MDVAGDSQGKGYQGAQGVQECDAQEVVEGGGFIPPGKQKAGGREGEYKDYLQSGIFWRFKKKDEKQKEMVRQQSL